MFSILYFVDLWAVMEMYESYDKMAEKLENMLDEEDLSDSDESASVSHSFASRPMSGKEARQARSARIRAALAGKQPLEAYR